VPIIYSQLTLGSCGCVKLQIFSTHFQPGNLCVYWNECLQS